MNCPQCQTEMVKARATNFGEEYDYCRSCKKELKELQQAKVAPKDNRNELIGESVAQFKVGMLVQFKTFTPLSLRLSMPMPAYIQSFISADQVTLFSANSMLQDVDIKYLEPVGQKKSLAVGDKVLYTLSSGVKVGPLTIAHIDTSNKTIIADGQFGDRYYAHESLFTAFDGQP